MTAEPTSAAAQDARQGLAQLLRTCVDRITADCRAGHLARRPAAEAQRHIYQALNLLGFDPDAVVGSPVGTSRSGEQSFLVVLSTASAQANACAEAGGIAPHEARVVVLAIANVAQTLAQALVAAPGGQDG